MNYNPKTCNNRLLRPLLCLSVCLFVLLLALAPALEARAESGTDTAGTANTAAGSHAASGQVHTARPSVNGHLHVEGTQLVDEKGLAVQLRGVSTHGLTWFPDYLNESLFRQISEDWDCSLMRLPMYSRIYCENEKSKAESLALVKKGIDLAIAQDMYVLVDWHILEDFDPNMHIDEAIQFFQMISSEYAGVPNLIFEICNEPNGVTGWTEVERYSKAVIPIIRNNCPDSVIVVGTPEYDRNLGSPLLRPLEFDNVMYVLHFYASSHSEGLRTEMLTAIDAGLPVFISECGISEASGDGKIDFASAAEWFSCLDERKISYTVWSLSDKDEASAFLKPGFDTEKKIEDTDLTPAGLWVRELIRLGLLQTPQCFYDPDVFQHALYSEKRAPNEQDFFYRTIEPAKTSTNSVIYGGSNTVLSRAALDKVGGFYTESITEDFATGLLIESNGFVSLGLGEPLASGQTPHTYKDHIQQRTRWGRGVIVTARKLKLMRRKGLTPGQRISYWSSVVYWYSPIKNLIYILSPLFFATFAIPVFKCNWLELLVFWFPMFVMQDVNLQVCSKRRISHKWSGIYETGVMPHLLVPILKESVGISMSTFKVTDKSEKKAVHESDVRSMIPFILLILLSVAGIVRVISIFSSMQAVSLCILLFWIIRNLYYLTLSLFLVDGRDSDTEPVKVMDAVPVTVADKLGAGEFEGVTTLLTEHNLTVFLDEDDSSLGIGSYVDVTITSEDHCARVSGVVTNVQESRKTRAKTRTIEILDFGTDYYEYLEHLYDRIPTLPQSLNRDFGIVTHLWQNIAHRVARTAR